ncbi:MAG: hypothetical protein R2800_09865 [Flavipsychrobacter sp.]
MKTINSFLGALLINALFAALIASVTPIPVQAVFATTMALSFLVGLIGVGKQRAQNMAFDGLFTDIWLDQLLEGFWDDDSFLEDGENWDDDVDNDTINLAEIGVDPNVIKDNAVYPVPFAERADTPLAIPLSTYDTEGTVTRRLQDKALFYNKRESIIKQHRKALRNFIANDGLYNIAPAAETANAPIIMTSGAVDPVLNVKIPTASDFMQLAIAYDNNKWDADRRMVMPPSVFWLFVNSDPVLKAQAERNGIGGTGTGKFVEYYDFKIRPRKTVARYSAAKVKEAKGSLNGTEAAVSYLGSGQSFGKGLGTPEMFARERDPEQKGDIVNFGLRAVILPKRAKTLGALVLAPNA